ncbi:35.6 kDa [Spodoptera frugiperda ascovirus 1a]|uniref:35.6 kDa n=1 Tax=Spodoptera frugiperda ascovirus 1a TaxID=113370 RepID=Q0E507_SFAVA|nr:35.6 kDa [Spodoptera frugiperda ascovirus 1a]CAL44694.1 35.6 kDa [Spodoptera frugiperda ascovirus 1a]
MTSVRQLLKLKSPLITSLYLFRISILRSIFGTRIGDLVYSSEMKALKRTTTHIDERPGGVKRDRRLHDYHATFRACYVETLCTLKSPVGDACRRIAILGDTNKCLNEAVDRLLMCESKLRPTIDVGRSTRLLFSLLLDAAKGRARRFLNDIDYNKWLLAEICMESQCDTPKALTIVSDPDTDLESYKPLYSKFGDDDENEPGLYHNYVRVYDFGEKYVLDVDLRCGTSKLKYVNFDIGDEDIDIITPVSDTVRKNVTTLLDMSLAAMDGQGWSTLNTVKMLMPDGCEDLTYVSDAFKVFVSTLYAYRNRMGR